MSYAPQGSGATQDRWGLLRRHRVRIIVRICEFLTRFTSIPGSSARQPAARLLHVEAVSSPYVKEHPVSGTAEILLSKLSSTWDASTAPMFLQGPGVAACDQHDLHTDIAGRGLGLVGRRSVPTAALRWRRSDVRGGDRRRFSAERRTTNDGTASRRWCPSENMRKGWK